MEETPNFDTGNLQILVIDEADILIEMGFQETLRAILRNIPKNRQTLLFSATLNKKMQELATLCLQKPERISLYT
jgi:ATP-dependent RNA helicase DDX10/DBP4